MSIFQAIILGITQGLTEFAPISSSGHLILVPWLFGWSIVEDAEFNKTFDVALHLGTLVGAVLYFRRDLWRYLIAWLGSIARRSVRTRGRAPGLGAGDRHHPGSDRRRGVRGRHSGPARRSGAHRGHARGVRGRPLRGRQAGAGQTVLRHALHARRPRPRGGTSPRPPARGLPIRRHHHGRPADGHRSGVRGPILLPPVDPDHRGRRPLQEHRRRADGTPARDGAGVLLGNGVLGRERVSS